jgi:hypothetical protein
MSKKLVIQIYGVKLCTLDAMVCLMADVSEVSPDICFVNVADLPRHDLHAQGLQRVVRVSPRPISVAEIAAYLSKPQGSPCP